MQVNLTNVFQATSAAMRRTLLQVLRAALTFLAVYSGATAAQAHPVDPIDISGYWEPVLMEDFQTGYAGPDPVDFTALPLNAAGRARALSYNEAILDTRERQCMYYGTDYLVTGPFGFRLTPQSDAVTGDTTSWRIGPWIDREPTVIHMDGLRPDQNALHTASGFTTGHWDGHTLTTLTTHLREGTLRRNGAPRSDEATMTMHFTRHGDYLEVTAIIKDPIYLSEPYVLSRLFKQKPDAYLQNDWAVPCDAHESDMPRGGVPHYLPDQNPLKDSFARNYGLPEAAVLGGAQTMYPEYRKTVEAGYKRPEKACDGFCCGWGDARNPDYYNAYAKLNCPGRKRTSPEVLNFINEPGG